MTKVVKPNMDKVKEAQEATEIKSNTAPDEMDSATKARMAAAEKARIQSTQTTSKLSVQDPIKT